MPMRNLARCVGRYGCVTHTHPFDSFFLKYGLGMGLGRCTALTSFTLLTSFG